MRALLLFLFFFSFSDEGLAKDEPTAVTKERVEKFRGRLMRKYDRPEIPFKLLPHVIGQVNYVNVRAMVDNWLAMPDNTRVQIAKIFADARVERYIFLALLESKGNPAARSKHDFGLFQVNERSGRAVCGLGQQELLDPLENARCAVKLLRQCARFRGWQAQVICYNGKLAVCPWKGYQSCLYKKWRAGDKTVATSLFYPIKYLVHREIGEQFLGMRFPPPSRSKKPLIRQKDYWPKGGKLVWR